MDLILLSKRYVMKTKTIVFQNKKETLPLFPQSKSEEYRYFPLGGLLDTEWNFSHQIPIEIFDPKDYPLINLQENTLYIFNGQIYYWLKNHCLELEIESPNLSTFDYFEKINFDESSQINLTLTNSPLSIIIKNTENRRLSLPHLKIVIPEGIKTSVTIQYQENDEMFLKNESMTISYLHFILKRKSHLELNLLSHYTQKNNILQFIKIEQEDSSYLLATANYIKAFFIRIHLEILLKENQAQCDIYGLYIGQKKSQMELYCVVKHLHSNTKSHQLVHGIVYDQAQFSFNGDIKVPRNINDCICHQLSRHMFLGKQAKIFVRPQLHIQNQNIDCSHGVTIGNLNADQIFYLNTRGIPITVAKQIMLKGFLEDILLYYSASWKNIISENLESIMEEIYGKNH